MIDIDKQAHDITLAYMSATSAHLKPSGHHSSTHMTNKKLEEFTDDYIKNFQSVKSALEALNSKPSL